jgi:glucose-6-phosphate 1-dehydrogenase
MRSDQVEAAWQVLMPVLTAWAKSTPRDFPNYAAGSWGPKAADELLAHEGHAWRKMD